MANYKQSYYLTWENGELVTADIMSEFGNGLFAQILSITDAFVPVILSGGKITRNEDNTINISAGYYRVANQIIGNSDISQHEIPGYFYAAEANNLTVNNGQCVVSRIQISTISQYTTIISGQVIVVDEPTAQDVILYQLNDDGTGIIEIQRDNDLQLIIPTINKSNQLIINSSTVDSIQLTVKNQKIIILNIAANGKLLLPDVTNGIYSIINSSTISFYLVPNSGYTILGQSQYLITPGSTLEVSQVNLSKCWFFM